MTTALFAVRGRSQRVYPYRALDILAARSEPIWQAGANFLIARQVPADEPLILYVGAAPNLFQFIDDSRCWETARWKYEADVFYAHPNDSEGAREAEREDLIAAHAPPLNADNWQSIIARALEM